MEPEGSLPYSQVPATCPFPEPNPACQNIERDFSVVYLAALSESVSGKYS